MNTPEQTMNKQEQMQAQQTAVAEFQFAMLKRLQGKTSMGATGWDDPEEVPDEELWKDVMMDVVLAKNGGENKHVDIANRIMFLWYRKRKRELGL